VILAVSSPLLVTKSGSDKMSMLSRSQFRWCLLFRYAWTVTCSLFCDDSTSSWLLKMLFFRPATELLTTGLYVTIWWFCLAGKPWNECRFPFWGLVLAVNSFGFIFTDCSWAFVFHGDVLEDSFMFWATESCYLVVSIW